MRRTASADFSYCQHRTIVHPSGRLAPALHCRKGVTLHSHAHYALVGAWFVSVVEKLKLEAVFAIST